VSLNTLGYFLKNLQQLILPPKGEREDKIRGRRDLDPCSYTKKLGCTKEFGSNSDCLKKHETAPAGNISPRVQIPGGTNALMDYGSNSPPPSLPAFISA